MSIEKRIDNIFNKMTPNEKSEFMGTISQAVHNNTGENKATGVMSSLIDSVMGLTRASDIAERARATTASDFPDIDTVKSGVTDVHNEYLYKDSQWRMIFSDKSAQVTPGEDRLQVSTTSTTSLSFAEILPGSLIKTYPVSGEVAQAEFRGRAMAINFDRETFMYNRLSLVIDAMTGAMNAYIRDLDLIHYGLIARATGNDTTTNQPLGNAPVTFDATYQNTTRDGLIANTRKTISTAANNISEKLSNLGYTGSQNFEYILLYNPKYNDEINSALSETVNLGDQMSDKNKRIQWNIKPMSSYAETLYTGTISGTTLNNKTAYLIYPMDRIRFAFKSRGLQSIEWKNYENLGKTMTFVYDLASIIAAPEQVIRLQIAP